MPHRKDTRVVGEAEPRQDFEGPNRLLRNGEAGGTISKNCAPADVLKKLLGASGVLTEFFWRHLVKSAVAKTMTGDLVTLLSEAAN